ncbi:two-component sensor histidine kinase [Vibrio viridaestus]|uniref:histidine kinase n=2 Tax=Vibrio viridaestus TaxID=2487322 RepID=A0A3N9TLL3_9VIBR|nr:two-component sensor histidine kinase [Vibrio viridaestus]
MCVALYFSYQSSRHEVYEVYDARLSQTAKLFLLTVASDNNDINLQQSNKRLEHWLEQIKTLAKGSDKSTTYGHPYEENILIRVYRDNRLVWNSQPKAGPIPHSDEFSGFGYTFADGQEWRFFQLHDISQDGIKNNLYIIVAEKQSIRNEMMAELALSSLLPQVILVPFIAFLLFWLIERNFKPIAELRWAIMQRSVNKLDAISVSQDTTELSPLVNALNSLLDELANAWKREKRFTRMAAHELKTPLAVLRLNVENAQLSRTKEELNSDFKQMIRGIERSDRLIQQLLTLARVESVHELHFSNIDLSSLLREVISDLVPLALKNSQDLSFIGEDVIVEGDESFLRLLFTNLVDNAIRYSGNNTQISVDIKFDDDDFVNVFVSDTGANVSDETREKLFESFYRSNRERGDGAGLGLAITKDIVELHNGKIELLPRSEDKNTFLVELKRFNS